MSQKISITGTAAFSFVLAGLVPVIHVFPSGFSRDEDGIAMRNRQNGRSEVADYAFGSSALPR
jgi:hypothetical protein